MSGLKRRHSRGVCVVSFIAGIFNSSLDDVRYIPIRSNILPLEKADCNEHWTEVNGCSEVEMKKVERMER